MNVYLFVFLETILLGFLFLCYLGFKQNMNDKNKKK